MNKEDIIELQFSEKYYSEGDQLSHCESTKLQITSKVKRKWYHLLLQWITLGCYQAPYYYTAKVLKDGIH